jgi:hypothetical protein
MSGPTRGMVAGQAITTQAQSKEYDEGYERVFGKGGGERGRFVWSEEAQSMVRVGSDWTDAETRAGRSEEEVYGHDTTADGTDISSKRKRRDYMKATGLADFSDFSPEWHEKNKRSKEREQDSQRRSDVVEVWRQHKRY